MQTCPKCAHTWGTKPKPIARANVDTSTLSNVELFAHYKRTSHIGDAQFFAERMIGLSLYGDTVELEVLAEEGLPKVETLRQLTALQDCWRRATGYPA